MTNSSSPPKQGPTPKKKRTAKQNLHTLGYPPHYNGTDSPNASLSAPPHHAAAKKSQLSSQQYVKPLPREEVEAAFQFFDIHNKKRLTPSDLKQRLSAFYPHLSNKEYKFLVSEPDFSIDTLMNILNHHTLRDFDPVKEAFKVFDPHDTGYMDKSMLKKILKNLGYGNITPEDMKVLVRTADGDGDGKISFDDWKNLTGFGPAREERHSTAVADQEGEEIPEEDGEDLEQHEEIAEDEDE